MAAAAPAAAAAAAPAADAKAAPSPLAVNFAAGETAVVIMDYQNGILSRAAGKDKTPVLLEKANAVLNAAREKKVPVIYVRVANSPGYGSAAKHNRVFSSMIGSGLLLENTDDTAIHPGIAPKEGDAVVIKRRFGAFHGTDLTIYLSSKNVRHIVMFGVSTAGCVLSTLRAAADADYVCTVVSDCCADPDPAVNEILLTKVFARQAVVVPSADVIAQINSLGAAATATAAAPAAAAK